MGHQQRHVKVIFIEATVLRLNRRKRRVERRLIVGTGKWNQDDVGRSRIGQRIREQELQGLAREDLPK